MAETSFRLPNETLYLHLAKFLETTPATAYPGLQDDENDDPFTKQRGMTLCSIHGAKGFQWKAVWFVDASEHVIPGRTRPDRPQELEEEAESLLRCHHPGHRPPFLLQHRGREQGFSSPTHHLLGSPG